jgi:hypothetical protein
MSNGRPLTLIIVVFIPDWTLAPGLDDFNALCSSDVSKAAESRRRSEDGDWLWGRRERIRKSDPHYDEVFSPLAQSRLSTGQGPTPTSISIHHGLSERTAAISFGSKRPGADVARVSR